MNEFQQVIVEEPAADLSPAEKKVSAGGYRVLAVIAFLIGAGGLFIGLLYSFSGIFLGRFRGDALLADSLFGYVYSYFQAMFTDVGAFFNALFTAGDMSSILSLLLVVLLCVSIVLSLVLMIVSFCSRKAAKNCAMTSSVLVFLSYAGFFLLCYYEYSVDNTAFGGGMFDVTTGIPAGVMLIALIITAFARRKGLALANLLFFLLTAAVIFGLTYPGSTTSEVPFNFMKITENLFVNLTAFIVAVVLIIAFVIASVRLNAKKAYAVDAVLYGVLFVAVVLAIVAQILDKTFQTMFDATNMLPVIVSVAAALAAFLLALIVAIVQTARARRKEAEAEANALNEVFIRQPAAEAQPEPAPAQQTVVAAEQAPEPAPAQQTVTPAGSNTTVIVQQPAPAAQPAAVPQAPIYAVPFFAAPMAPAVQPAPAPAPAEEPKPAPKPQEEMKQEETPMSEFEKSMADLARGIAPEPAQEAPAYRYAPAPAPAPAPAYAKAAAAPAAFDPTPYTYDNFINSLTPQERNEFGDLFIGNRYGDLNYLPAYVIGGDNREFFSRVFIYLGKFRSHISPALLGKLYDHVAKM